MRKESHSSLSLDDFVQNIDIPPILNRDYARTQAGDEWTAFECQLCINSTMTEPKSPWQNKAEHSINDLGTMVWTNMREFNAPLYQHHWHMKWCKDSHNALAMRKLG